LIWIRIGNHADLFGTRSESLFSSNVIYFFFKGVNLDPLLYRGGYDRRDERGGSGYDRKDYGRRDDRGYDRNERLHTEMFVDLVFIFASLKVELFSIVAEPRAEEPKLNYLPEPEPKLRIAAPAPFYLPQT
jgi:hypothetical protein